MKVKPVWNECAGADRIIHHLQWLYRQECFQILAQWIWNLRLELGQHLAPAAVRTTTFAPAHAVSLTPESSPASESSPTSAVIYGPPHWAGRSFTGGFPGSAFTLQPDGTLRCPADRPLYAQERRSERNGSLRALFAGRIAHCRACPRLSTVSRTPLDKKATAGQRRVLAHPP